MTRAEKFLRNFWVLVDQIKADRKKALFNLDICPDYCPDSTTLIEDFVSIGTWNKRYTEMENLLHKGVQERQLIVEALVKISKQKDLSFGERKMLYIANNYDRWIKEQEEKEVNVINLQNYKFNKDNRGLK